MSSEAKVGTFVLVGLVLVAVAIFLLGDFTFEDRYVLNVLFTEVSSLTKSSPVKVSGVDVGQVKDVTLEGGKAKVIASIREGVDVYRNAQFTVGSTGIIGSKYLEITQGTPEAGVIPPGSTVAGVDPVPIDKAMAKALQSLDRLIGGLNGDVQPGTLASNLNETVGNMKDLTANLNELIETVKPQMTNAMSRTDAITDKLDSLLAKSNQMMAGLASDKGAMGAMLHDEKLKSDIKETVSSFKDVAATAKDVVGRLNQFRVYWNYDWRYEDAVKASRTDIGLKIYPREGRYYYVGGSNLGNVSDIRRGPDESRDVDYAQVNRVDALLGFEKGPFDAAVGVIRSGGGARLTVTPFWQHQVGKRFSLTAQGYDFGRHRVIEGRRFARPHYDFSVMGRITRFLGIGARAEDVAEVPRYQAWANVTFEDKDIAYLFGMISFGAAGTKGRSKRVETTSSGR